ncbi:MAG: radical SAM protein [Candidatus Omnitrophota bacterium]
MDKENKNINWTRRDFLKNGLKAAGYVSAGVLCGKLCMYVSGKKQLPDNYDELKEAWYYEKLSNNKVKCLLCVCDCIIEEGQTGFCKARINLKGGLYSLVYGAISCDSFFLNVAHSLIFSSSEETWSVIGTAGCNMRCKFCLNWTMSQADPAEVEIVPFILNEDPMDEKQKKIHKGKKMLVSPEQLVSATIQRGNSIIGYNYNEPTVYYEYMFETAKLAKNKGLINLIATNGYMHEKPLLDLLPYMDAVSIGIKGFDDEIYRNYCGARLDPVLKTLRILKRENILFEITYVLIPAVNDDMEQIKKMCVWIRDNLGPEIPLHFYRFSPNYLMPNLPQTPISLLEKAQKIAWQSGIKYVYIYFLGKYLDSTIEEKIYCPNCNKLLLHRKDMRGLLENNTVRGKCKFCGEKILFYVK